MAHRVLIVEDEPEFADLMALWLGRAGHETVTASDGVAAMRALYDERPDLVTLDVALPRLDGWAVLGRMREVSDVPILIVSARGSEAERVRGLQLGADDYLTKPFAFREFVARVDAALRRATQAAPRTPAALHHRDLVVDDLAHRVLLAGSEIHLTPTEFRVLSCLARRPGQLVTHAQLLREAWGPDYGSELHLLRMAIRSIRAKLAEVAPAVEYVATDYGLGYRLSAGR